jgi:hypothetical protein
MRAIDEWLLWLEDMPPDVKELYNEAVQGVMFEAFLGGLAFGLILAGAIGFIVFGGH